MKNFLSFRMLLFLSLAYLGLVGLLYSILWRAQALDLQLFETPAESGRAGEQLGDHETVQFNFKRKGNPRIDLRLVNATKHCVHAFYYMWYGNKDTDGHYIHWNHRYLPHWNKELAGKYPEGKHTPPGDIGSIFYPELGCYSSGDPVVVERHVQQMRDAGIGVASVSWYPPGRSDEEGTPSDSLLPLLLDLADKHGLKVAIHSEPYKERTPQTFAEDLQYIHRSYSKHPALYKMPRLDHDGIARHLPLVYVYDSYLSSVRDWAEVLQYEGKSSIRGKAYDCIAIGLLVEKSHMSAMVAGGFDGFYTYFASDGFSYGSDTSHWATLAKYAADKGLVFIPSIGPGYDDTKVRPWNARTTKKREDGGYYKRMFVTALEAGATFISITSFNEWHEGTQIEPAIPMTTKTLQYQSYYPYPPHFYLQLTKELSQNIQCSLQHSR